MSVHEESLALQITRCRLERNFYARQFRFHPTRKWQMDFAWPEQKLAVEVDGAIWVNGRHSRGAGILGDMEKYAEAMLLGWRVLRVAPEHIKSGKAVDWIEALLKQ